MLPMTDAGLPKMVMEQTPKRYQKAKLPIAKVKVGPQIMNMICDDAIFDELPTRGEVKAMVSGIYIISVKSIRGKKVAQEEETGKKKKGKKGLFAAFISAVIVVLGDGAALGCMLVLPTPA